MGVVESQYAIDRVGTIYRNDCEEQCCYTRYYRMSQSTRRDQFSSFARGALYAHNMLREKHNAPPLQLNMRLCKMAESQARFLADNEMFEHSTQEERRHSDGYCGENMSESIVWHDEYRRPLGEEVSLLWYDEGEGYDFKSCKFDPERAQFTQLIWKNTKIFGISYAEYEPEDNPGFVKTVIVANYFPGGNIESKFSFNVARGKEYGGTGSFPSKVQRKINQYQRQKVRRAKTISVLTGKHSNETPGNLGFPTFG